MADYGLSKKDTLTKILIPLQKEFSCKIFFNGEQPKEVKLHSRYAGICHYEERMIIIRWQRNFMKTVKTLFHEIGHLNMHTDKDWELGKYRLETEAESVAMRVFEYAGFPAEICVQYFYQEKCNLRYYYDYHKLTQYFKRLKDGEYPNCRLDVYVPPKIRWSKVERTARRIVNTFESLVEIIGMRFDQVDGSNLIQGEQLSLFE